MPQRKIRANSAFVLKALRDGAQAFPTLLRYDWVLESDHARKQLEHHYQSIPVDLRPSKKQPFYHLMAENSETFYSAYVSQQNIIMDSANGPVDHPDLEQMFSGIQKGRYLLKPQVRN